MKNLTFPITLLLVLLILPRICEAHDYEDDAVRFTIPGDYAYSTTGEDGTGGFHAEKNGLSITLFRTSDPEDIDKKKCLSLDDENWFPGLSKLQKIKKEFPKDKPYNLVTTYKSDKGFIRIYRYISRHELGFLVAETPQDSWDEADAIADSQRYTGFGDRVRELKRKYGFHALGLLLVAAILYYTVRKFRRGRFAVYLLLCLTAGAALVYFVAVPALPLRIIGVLALTSLFCIYYDGDSDTDSQDGPEDSSGSDGTGTTFNHNF